MKTTLPTSNFKLRMASGPQMWSRGLLFLMVVAVALANENSDDFAIAEDIVYQGDVNIDSPSIAEKIQASNDDMRLYRILQALQSQDVANYRTDVTSNGDMLSEWDHLQEPLNLKRSVFKRLSNLGSPNPPPRVYAKVLKQPKWKIKKGKAIGSQMVCYFKLCAFRPPAYT